MPQRLARLISILGHPLLTLPSAALALVAVRDPNSLRSVAIGFALVAAGVMGFSWRQVKHERWTHVDASHPKERAGLNRALLLLLAVSTALAMLGGMRELALGLALSASLIGAALALARWCKLSLHVAFAMYAAGLLWSLSAFAAIAACAFAAAIAWSRLKLERHRPRDVAFGVAFGALAATAYFGITQTAALSMSSRI
jgi:membrane-associated phospholipid phosphatase